MFYSDGFEEGLAIISKVSAVAVPPARFLSRARSTPLQTLPCSCCPPSTAPAMTTSARFCML